jgi:hypothetical protein
MTEEAAEEAIEQTALELIHYKERVVALKKQHATQVVALQEAHASQLAAREVRHGEQIARLEEALGEACTANQAQAMQMHDLEQQVQMLQCAYASLELQLERQSEEEGDTL